MPSTLTHRAAEMISVGDLKQLSLQYSSPGIAS